MESLAERVAEKVVAAFGPHTWVVELQPVPGDASSRRYFRATLEGRGGPGSVMVMNWSEVGLPVSSEELAVFSEPPEELPFLNVYRFLKGIGVRVPEVYGHWVDEGLMLLEDLGDMSLWDRVREAPKEDVVKWYRKAIDELLTLQIRGTWARDNSCMAFQQTFDGQLYLWELAHFTQYGLEQGDRGSLLDTDRRVLDTAFKYIAEHLAGQPKVLSHRDFHSWNLMVHNGEVAVIDFQDALLAPRQYDLASLLNDRETDRVITVALEERLIDYYLERTEALGEPKPTRDSFWETYLMSALQRDLKVVGRFRYLDLVKGKPAYKRFVPPTLARIGRNLERMPALERLRVVLAGHFKELL